MKKTALIIFCTILFFCACKKSATSNTATPTQKFGTMSAVINGTQVNFNTGAIAIGDNPGGYWQLALYGAADTSRSAANFIIIIDSVHGPIVPGIYMPGGAAGIKDSIIYYATDGSYYNDPSNKSYQSQVTITSNTDKGGVQGTFSGTLIDSSSSPAKTITITDGKFSVPYQ